jgi:hypothetical protein
MKKYLLPFSLFISIAVSAQVPEDAIRFSFYPQNGTARNLAIGGAMGSLGGDLNATFVNPAGLGFYKTGEFVLTPGFLLNNNKINYREATSQNNKNAFAFGTTGLVLGYGSHDRKNSSNAISLVVTQTASFNNRIQYKGLNNYSSFSEQFAEEFAKARDEDGNPYTIDAVLNANSPLPYGSAPALYTYLIDTVRVNGLLQIKGAPEYILDAGQALQQEMIKTTKGGITEIALAYAHNKDDKWYFGGSIAIPIVNYSSHTIFRESDTSSNTTNHFKQFEYTDNFTTKGVGANAKIGIIYKPREQVRLGLAIHTPSFMSLKDRRTTTIATSLENPVDNFTVSSQTFTNDQPGQSQYSQNTPFKAIISGSYVFREIENVKKQRAFVTADVEYVHHKGSKFGSQNEEPTEGEKEYYKALTRVIKASYKGNFNFRVGGELKFNVFMARLGFAYYGNPYKDAAYKARRMLLSGGLGYRNKGMFIDISYMHAMNKDVDFPYRLEDRANTYATLKQTRGNAVATLGFKF